jgi:catechol 2,3-dioxygenase-like lactoylglutathione lyase family enzyme
MEAIINGLLTDFEKGKMTRRQLIQSLSLAAVAAAPAGTVLAQGASTIPKAAAPAPWKTVWLDHISYAVNDYRKSTAFYRDLMGWEVKNDDGKGLCTMTIGDIGEIMSRNGREGAAPAGAPAAAPVTGVINHVSWGVQPWDTDKVKAELDKRGLNPRVDNQGTTFRSFHVKDPDGWDLQISNQTKEHHDSSVG